MTVPSPRDARRNINKSRRADLVWKESRSYMQKTLAENLREMRSGESIDD